MQHFFVQFLSLIPSLLIGLLYAVQYGNWVFFAAVGASFIVALLTRRNPGRAMSAEIDAVGLLRVDGRAVSRFPIFWHPSQRDAILKLVVSPTDEDLSQSLTHLAEAANRTSMLALGVTKTLAPVLISLNQSAPHLLVIGPTGSGKSVLLRNFAKTAQPMLDVDFKGGGNLSNFISLGRLNNLDHNPEGFWGELNRILDEREGHPNVDQPSLYVFVDELAATLASSALAAKTLERVATRGRSSSLFLIAASQSTSGIPRNIILNCQHRVLLGAVDPIDRTQLGARGTRSAWQDHPDQLFGEYLFEGAQTEFLLMKPGGSAPTISIGKVASQNPLAV